MKFTTGTAIVTPMKNGNIDLISYEKLLKFQVENGIDAIFPVGTTGENVVLSIEEWTKIVEFTTRFCKGKNVKVIAGICQNGTKKALEYVKIAEKIKVDGIMLVTPFYNKPTQDGLFAHFSEIARNTPLPIILYNVPGRTNVDLQDITTAKLAKEFKNIVALKDATGNVSRISTLRYTLQEQGVQNEDFSIYSGDDISALGAISLGASGVISVISNIFPKQVSKMINFGLNEDIKSAIKTQDILAKLSVMLFAETSPAPVKYCLSKLGFCENEIRLPLVTASVDLSNKLNVLLENIQKTLDNNLKL